MATQFTSEEGVVIPFVPLISKKREISSTEVSKTSLLSEALREIPNITRNQAAAWADRLTRIPQFTFMNVPMLAQTAAFIDYYATEGGARANFNEAKIKPYIDAMIKKRELKEPEDVVRVKYSMEMFRYMTIILQDEENGEQTNP